MLEIDKMLKRIRRTKHPYLVAVLLAVIIGSFWFAWFYLIQVLINYIITL